MASTQAKLTHSDWRESKSCEAEGHTLSPMHCRYHYTGSLEGESVFEGVIYYLGDSGSYTGYELFTGGIEGRQGTCVLRSVGGFAPDAVHAELEVVPESGTGALTGLRGGGRMHQQGLYRREEQPAILDLGLQQVGTSVAQALAARTPRIGWDHPDLTLAWTYRGAPHLHWNAHLDPLSMFLAPRSEAGAAARLAWSRPQVERCGMPAMEAIETVASIAAEVITAPMTKGAASAAITERIPHGLGHDCRPCQSFHVNEQLIRVAMLPAGIVLDRQAPRLVLLPRKPRRVPKEPNPAAAIRTYLRFLGPATINETAAFFNSTQGELASIWPSGLFECIVDGSLGYLLEQPDETPEEPIVRILPPMDPYLQARNREFLVPDALARKRLWRVLGNPGVLLVHGEILGTVRQKMSGSKLDVTVEPFGHTSASVREHTEAEAERLATLRGANAVRVSWVS